MKNAITCQIRWGHKWTDGEYKGRISIHADVPMDFWPENLPEPSFQSTTSTFVDGHCVNTQPWHRWTPIENYYQPQWLRDMSPGTERWKLWHAYEKALHVFLWDRWQGCATAEKQMLKLPESTVQKPVFKRLPSRSDVLEAIGFLTEPAAVV